jgi:hypothetical protein
MEFAEPSNHGSVTETMGVIKSADLAALLGRSQLGKVPTVDDFIQLGSDRYQPAAPLPGFSHYGYARPDQVTMRIHLKQVN